jgi:4-amino-4-deoxy-L-arabinose transferase
MGNLFYGILTLVLCTVIYFFSWTYHRKEYYRVALLLLVLGGLLLRLYTSTDFFLHDWDERYHALVAKNMISQPFTPVLYEDPVLSYDYRDWTSNHVWLHKQPLPLWAMAGSMWLFGINEIALRLPSLILSLLGIWLTFYIGSYLFNKRVGYLAAFLHSINGLIIELAAGRVATDHIDTFFLFFVELAIFFSILQVRKKGMIYTILAGVSIGAAVLSKWLPALIVLPVWLLLTLDSGKFSLKPIMYRFIVLIFSCVVVCLPWQIYIHHAFPLVAAWESGLNFRHLTEVIEGRTGPFYYFIDTIRINYGELIYLPLIWFVWRAFRNLKDLRRMAVSIWFLVPLVFFSFARTKMQAYLLFTAPALFLMTADFFFMLNAYRKSRRLNWLYIVVLILLIALPVRYTIERIKPFDRRERNPQWRKELKEFNTSTLANGVLLNYPRPVEAMFYTDLTVYPHLPDRNSILAMLDKGYIVVINDDGNIPPGILNLEGVKFHQFTASATEP